ncbi:hypothetical protein EON65_52030 [archaeon]|nr:MAG: hypothetical protein EON65_52030 [archaeon]
MLFGKVVNVLQPRLRSADLFITTKCKSTVMPLTYYHGYLNHAQHPRVVDVSKGFVTLKCPNQELQRIILSTLVLGV